jgi:hypothetical protein
MYLRISAHMEICSQSRHGAWEEASGVHCMLGSISTDVAFGRHRQHCTYYMFPGTTKTALGTAAFTAGKTRTLAYNVVNSYEASTSAYVHPDVRSHLVSASFVFNRPQHIRLLNRKQQSRS